MRSNRSSQRSGNRFVGDIRISAFIANATEQVRTETGRGAAWLIDKSSASLLPLIIPNDEYLDGALFVCARYAFRIASIEPIYDREEPSSLLLDRSHTRAGIIGAIDYAYDSDRESLLFKPFSKWAEFDFDEWLLRTRDDADLLRLDFIPSKVYTLIAESVSGRLTPFSS